MNLIDQVAALEAKGHDTTHIAAKLGLTEKRVDQILERLDGAYDAEKTIRYLAEKELAAPAEQKTIRPAPECGTPQALRIHTNRGQTCDVCTQASISRKQAARKRAVAARPKSDRVLKPCGTWAAYQRHHDRGEPPCEPCKAAARDRNRRYEASRRRAREKKDPTLPKPVKNSATTAGKPVASTTATGRPATARTAPPPREATEGTRARHERRLPVAPAVERGPLPGVPRRPQRAPAGRLRRTAPEEGVVTRPPSGRDPPTPQILAPVHPSRTIRKPPTMTDTQQVRPFAATLQDIDKGRVHTDAGQHLHDLIEACLDTGKAGQLTITIKVKVAEPDERRLTVTGEVVSKIPRADPKAAIFWADSDGNLVRSDPSQHEFDLSPVKAVPAATNPERTAL